MEPLSKSNKIHDDVNTYEFPASISEIRYANLPDDKKEVLNKLRQEFKTACKDIDDESAKELSAETKTMISFVQSRIQEWNHIRTSSLQISLGLLTFSVLGLALEINNQDKLDWHIFLTSMTFLLLLLLTSLLYFIILSKQVSFDYPFIDVAKTWRWFFLYTISNDMPFSSILRRNARLDSQELFLQGLIAYSKATAKIKCEPQAEFMQDVEQLYLLLVYEGYMFQFSRKANNLLRRGIIFSIVFSISLLLAVVTWQFFFP